MSSTATVTVPEMGPEKSEPVEGPPVMELAVTPVAMEMAETALAVIPVVQGKVLTAVATPASTEKETAQLEQEMELEQLHFLGKKFKNK